MSTNQRKLYVIYGSETGNSEVISKRIHVSADSLGIESKWISLKDFRSAKLLDKWPNDGPVVVVVSSTGQGEAPESSLRFWRQFNRTAQPGLLEGVHFAMLGLGDTNYDTWQGFPKNLAAKMIELGGTEFFERGEADDGTGLEEVVEPWIDQFWPALEKFYSGDTSLTLFNSEGGETTAVSAATTPSEGSTVASSTAPSNTEASTPAPVAADSTETEDKSTKKEDVGDGEGEREKKGDAEEKKPKRKFIRKKGGGAAAMVSNEAEASKPAAAKPPPQHVPFLGIELLDTTPEHKPFKDGDGLSSQKPIRAVIVSAKRLTHPDAVKEVIHVELQLPQCELAFQPGDAFGFTPPNSLREVTDLLERLGLTGDKVVDAKVIDPSKQELFPQHIPFPVTVRDLFLLYLDITALPRRPLLRVLSESCSDASEKASLLQLATLDVTGKYRFAAEVETLRPSLLTLLRRFPSCQPPLSHLIELLPPILPRNYSLSNRFISWSESDENKKGRIEFAITVVKVKLEDGSTFEGLATSFLKSLLVENALITPLITETDCRAASAELSAMVREEKPQLALPIFQRSVDVHNFRLPEDALAPIIMIGPGTGVTPFRSFLQHRDFLRNAAVSLGESLLFFGARNPDLDGLYLDDFNELEKSGTLTRFITAYSRVEADKVVYVQHRLRENAEFLMDLMLNKEGIVYVCGDVGGIVKDVRETWIEMVSEHTKEPVEKTREIFAEWVNQKRYLIDIWS